MYLRRLKDVSKKTSFLRCIWDVLKTSQKSHLFWDVSKRSLRCLSQWRSDWDLSETSHGGWEACRQFEIDCIVSLHYYAFLYNKPNGWEEHQLLKMHFQQQQQNSLLWGKYFHRLANKLTNILVLFVNYSALVPRTHLGCRFYRWSNDKHPSAQVFQDLTVPSLDLTLLFLCIFWAKCK